jgi:two-component system, LuxR family, response regulator FixJ
MTLSVPDRVFAIVDDQVARELTASFVRLHGVEAHMYESAERFIAEFDGKSTGCLLIDMHGTPATGLNLQKQLASAAVGLPVIMVTASRDVQTAVGAMRNGAVTCLEKPFGELELWVAICEAVRFSDWSNEYQCRRIDAQRRLATLTPDERRVLTEIMNGKLNKKIAKDLDLGLRTVELRRAMILQKMAARSLPELGQMVMLTGENTMVPGGAGGAGFVHSLYAADGFNAASASFS